MKFGELWKNDEIHDILKGRQCKHFSMKKFNYE